MIIYLFLFILINPLLALSQCNWNHQYLNIYSNSLIDTTLIFNINLALPKYCMRYREYFMPGNIAPNLGTTCFRADIYILNADTVLQTIKSSSDVYGGPTNYEYGYSPIGLEGMLIDYNFDNYKDIRFTYTSGVNAYAVNQFYEVYLFNPIKNIFELDTSFSKLCNPTPFPKENVIRAYYRGLSFGREGGVETFILKDDKLILIRTDNFKIRNEHILDSLGWNKSEFLYYINYYKDDNIIKSDSTIIKGKRIPEIYKRYWGG